MNRYLHSVVRALCVRLVHEAVRRRLPVLPSIRAVAGVSGVSNRTVAGVLRELEREGYVAVVQGKGVAPTGKAFGAGELRKARARSRHIPIDPLFEDTRGRRPGGDTPALGHAVETIRSLLRQADASGRLPAMRSIAATAGVSTGTIKRALALLSRGGEVVTIRGKGVFTAAGGRNVLSGKGRAGESKPPKRKKKWEQLRERILRDIGGGVYPPGAELPSLQSLAHTCGTSYQPMKRALMSLAGDGHLHPFKRGYRVPGLGSARSAAVVLFVDAHARLDTAHVYPQLIDTVGQFERACRERDMALHVVFLRDTNWRRIPLDRLGVEKIAEATSIFGFCFRAGRGTDDLSLVRWLARFRKPIAVIDDVGEGEYDEMCAQSRKTAVFKLGTGNQGACRVAEYLLRLGHTNAAYFSQYHTTVWSRARCETIGKTFARNRTGTSLVSFTLGEEHFKALARLHLHVSPAKYERLLQPRYLRRERNLIARNLMHHPKVRRRFSGLFSLFDRALAQPEITAWIASNDEAASLAFEYLTDKRVAVPGRISLIAFDNTPDLYYRGITSYDFDLGTVVRTIMGFFFDGGFPAGMPPADRVIETEGRLLERRTTGRAATEPGRR